MMRRASVGHGLNLSAAGNSPSEILRFLTLLTVLAICFAPRPSWAHGGGPGLDYDPCARRAGVDYFVHFAAYQPQFNQFEEYCDSLPRGGQTILVFDLLGSELTNIPVSIEIEGGAHRLSIPARLYRSGVVHVQAELEPGNYTAFVTIGEPPGTYRLAFPFSVGAWWNRLVGPMLLGSLILLATAAYCAYQLRLGVAESRRTTPNTIVDLSLPNA
jgi:hypothetical protein